MEENRTVLPFPPGPDDKNNAEIRARGTSIIKLFENMVATFNATEGHCGPAEKVAMMTLAVDVVMAHVRCAAE